MKQSLLGILLILSIGCSNEKKESDKKESHANHAESNTQKKVKSPRTMAMNNIGENHIHIDYSSPRVRGRQIFGGLVAYGEVWVTGAHKATNITFNTDVIIANKEIDAGKYGLFTVPGESSWIVILNSVWDMHLADDYDESKDIIRVEVSIEKTPENQEELLFEVETVDEKSGKINFAWADQKFSLDIMNK